MKQFIRYQLHKTFLETILVEQLREKIYLHTLICEINILK